MNQITDKQLFSIYSIAAIFKVSFQVRLLDQLYENYDSLLPKLVDDEIQKRLDSINSEFDVENMSENEIKIHTDKLYLYFRDSIMTKQILSNYLINATWSYYEIGLKNLLKHTNKLTDNQVYSCYKSAEKNKLLNNKFNIDFKLLDSYSLLEELRLLNNDLKHQGKVSLKLNGANPKWEINQKIEDTFNDYCRLKNAPYDLLLDLQKKLLNRRKPSAIYISVPKKNPINLSLRYFMGFSV